MKPVYFWRMLCSMTIIEKLITQRNLLLSRSSDEEGHEAAQRKILPASSILLSSQPLPLPTLDLDPKPSCGMDRSPRQQSLCDHCWENIMVILSSDSASMW
ncbi:hypothetical protein FF2_042251 [Malus domestica]